MDHMELEHGFKATSNQYKKRIHKWDLTKYIKESEYRAMIRIMRQREQENPSKRTQFELNGKVVDRCNIDRFENRAALKPNPTNDAATCSGSRNPPGLRYWTPRSPAESTQEASEFPFSDVYASQGISPLKSLPAEVFPFSTTSPTNQVVKLIQDLTQGNLSSQEDQRLLFDICQRKEDFVRLVLKSALPSLEQHPGTACFLALFASGFYFFNRIYETAERLMTSIISAVMDQDCLRNTPYKINIGLLALFITKCYVALGGRSDMFAPLKQTFDATPRHFGEKTRESVTSEKENDIIHVEMGQDLNEALSTVIAVHQSPVEETSETASGDGDCVWHWEEQLRNKYLRRRGTAALDMRMVPRESPSARDERVPWYMKEAELTRRLDESQVGCRIVGRDEDHSILRIYLNFWDLLE